MATPTQTHAEHLELTAIPKQTVDAWAMNASCEAPVVRPTSLEDLKNALATARREQVSAGLRGSGCSYGDAALNSRGLVFDMRSMNRIISFDTETGVINVEPGVTIEQIWRHTLPSGWWPPVVPGTMVPTLGGCLAMNIHGKNNFQAGTIGAHVRAFDLLLANGTTRTCTPDQDPDLFFAAIGSFGVLGVFTRIEIQLKKVWSGDLRVRAQDTRSIPEMITFFEKEHENSDYLVGWVDALGGGRGLIHQAWYLKQGEDTEPKETLRAEHQDLPPRFFLVVPRTWLWRGLWFFFSRPGMRLVNAVKYWSGRRHAKKPPHRQSLVGFSFLLDYVPDWKHAYKPGAFIQYQSFVPKEHAGRVFNAQIALCKKHGIQPFLGVLKKHQPDGFLMTHAVDGYSLALDLPLKRGNRKKLWALAHAMDEVVIAAGGRFYFAKDSTAKRSTLARAYPRENVARLRAMKDELDPGGLFETDLYRRLFAKA